MSATTRNTSNYAQAAKNPAAWALVFIAMLVSSVITILVRSDNKEDNRTTDCKEQLRYCQTGRSSCDSEKNALVYELLKERATREEIPKAVDSLSLNPHP